MAQKNEDRISNLPEEILCRILSSLPAKHAVATSTLSTRWKSLYTSLDILDFDDLNPADDDSVTKAMFTEFVDKLLRSNTSPTIHTVRLRCTGSYGESTVKNWISTALSRNPIQLDVSTHWDDCNAFDVSGFSGNLKTLQVLKLREVELPEVPESVVFPNLKVLRLVEIVFWDHDTVGSYFRSCPVLEEFSMSDCALCYGQVFRVCHATLIKFTSYYCHGCADLVFDTPSLQHLELSGRYDTQTYTVKNDTDSIVTAGFDIQLKTKEPSPAFDQLAKFISDMHNVRSLNLSGSAPYIMSRSHCQLVTFQNLRFLELGALVDEAGLFFLDLLECFPSLEVLVFYEGFVDCNGGDENKFELLFPDAKPACLSKTLQELRVRAFHGSECEMEVAKYFLTNGDVLRKMMIGSVVHLLSPFGFSGMQRRSFEMDPECVSCTSETLATVNRSSRTCQIVLSWNEDGKPCRTII